MGELCDRIDAFGSELPPAIALQLCALAAVVGLRGFIARESTGTDFSLGGAKIISAVGSCCCVWLNMLSSLHKKTNARMEY